MQIEQIFTKNSTSCTNCTYPCFAYNYFHFDGVLGHTELLDRENATVLRKKKVAKLSKAASLLRGAERVFGSFHFFMLTNALFFFIISFGGKRQDCQADCRAEITASPFLSITIIFTRRTICITLVLTLVAQTLPPAL